jgi:MFS family permease
MSAFTRLTVVGSTRKAELVVPDDESIGGLIPQLMDLLDEQSGSVARPLALVRSTGEQLDAALSAAEQQLADGELLRLLRADEAPPPPEVADVTDVLADSYGDRPGRWSERSREVTGAVALGALSVVAGLVTPVLAAVVLGRLRRRWPAIALIAVGTGGAVPVAAVLLAQLAPERGPLSGPLFLALVSELAWVVLGLGVGLGLRRPPALAGGAVGVGSSALPLVLVAAGLEPVRAVAVTAVAVVVLCGLLPWYALTTSGLTGLDDQVLAGRPHRREGVLETVDDAYRALSWSTFALALPAAVTATVLTRGTDGWALALGGAVVVVTALRTRAFPLAAQQMPLWFAAAGAAVAVVVDRVAGGGGTAGLVLLGLAVVVTVLVAARPADHQRARLRRLGNLVEAVAVVAMVPLLLGVFGIYTDLLGAFR